MNMQAAALVSQSVETPERGREGVDGAVGDDAFYF